MTTCPCNLIFELLDRFLLQQIGRTETVALVGVYAMGVVPAVHMIMPSSPASPGEEIRTPNLRLMFDVIGFRSE
jgi:hypothetical protein